MTDNNNQRTKQPAPNSKNGGGVIRRPIQFGDIAPRSTEIKAPPVNKRSPFPETVLVSLTEGTLDLIAAVLKQHEDRASFMRACIVEGVNLRVAEEEAKQVAAQRSRDAMTAMMTAAAEPENQKPVMPHMAHTPARAPVQAAPQSMAKLAEQSQTVKQSVEPTPAPVAARREAPPPNRATDYDAAAPVTTQQDHCLKLIRSENQINEIVIQEQEEETQETLSEDCPAISYRKKLIMPPINSFRCVEESRRRAELASMINWIDK